MLTCSECRFYSKTRGGWAECHQSPPVTGPVEETDWPVIRDNDAACSLFRRGISRCGECSFFSPTSGSCGTAQAGECCVDPPAPGYMRPSVTSGTLACGKYLAFE